MKNSKKRLKPVISVAESREKTAANELSEAISKRDYVKEQISQLKDYRDEYKRSAILEKTHTRETFADTQLFLTRLNNSIELMENQLQQLDKNHAAVLKNWKESRAWTKSLEKVVDRHEKAEAGKQRQREQKDMDEIAGLTLPRYPKVSD